MHMLDVYFSFAKLYHGVEEAYFSGCLQVGERDDGFLDDAMFQKAGTLGAGEQGILGGEPSLAVMDG